MKLSFSTVGCPHWTWTEIVSAAKDLGYAGIELRGIGEDVFMPDIRIFSPEHVAKTRDDLKRAGLEIPCVTSDVLLLRPGRDQLAAARYYIALAANLGVPYVRVLGGMELGPVEGDDPQTVVDALKTLAPFAEGAGVCLLLESNGIFANSKTLKNTLDAVASPSVAALWDINHPVRFGNELPEETYANLKDYVKHVHVKDSRMENGKLAYKMAGYGDLPLKEAFALLKKDGYAGYLSLEWTKRWNAELEDAGIVFSHYVHAVRGIWDKA